MTRRARPRRPGRSGGSNLLLAATLGASAAAAAAVAVATAGGCPECGAVREA